MKVRTYGQVESFLRDTQAALELNEAANSLMLGVCLGLIQRPEHDKPPPCLKAVFDPGPFPDSDRLVLAAMMTPPHKLVLSPHLGDPLEGARILVEDLAGDPWLVPGVFGPGPIARAAASRWAEISGQGVEVERRQRIYDLRLAPSPTCRSGRLRPATASDAELVAQWWHAFNLEALGQADEGEARRAAEPRVRAGDIYLWADPRPVSMAMKTRPTRRGISVSAVYTPPDVRGRGYATACVGELSRLLLESGWQTCALFADLSNQAANRLYQRIGYQPICDYDEVRFLEADAVPSAGCP